MNAIQLGSVFKQICESFDLNVSRAGKYLKKYILHQLCEELLTSLSFEEVKLMEKYCNEPLGDTIIEDTTFGDILDINFFENPKRYFEFYDYDILRAAGISIEKDEVEKIKETISKRIFKNIPYSQKALTVNEGWLQYAKVSGSFFPLFKDYARSYRKVLTEQAYQIENVREILDKYIDNTNNYLSLLQRLGDDLDPSEDLLSFERKTDLFFLLNTHLQINALDFEIVDKGQRDDYFKVLSSFSLIDDIDLKLYFTKIFVEKTNISVDPTSDLNKIKHMIRGNNIMRNTSAGYVRLFALIFIYIPFLKEYLKDKIISIIPYKTFQLSEEIKLETMDKRERLDLIQLKRKMYIYLLLKNGKCYDIEDIKKQLDLDNTENLHFNTNTINFFELYKKIDHLRVIRQEFCEAVSEYVQINISRNKEKLIENTEDYFDSLLLNIVELFTTNRKLHILKNVLK